MRRIGRRCHETPHSTTGRPARLPGGAKARHSVRVAWLSLARTKEARILEARVLGNQPAGGPSLEVPAPFEVTTQAEFSTVLEAQVEHAPSAAPDGATHLPTGSVVVLGGTGFIGRAITRALLDEGFDVSVVSRGPSKEEARRVAGAEIVQADASDVAAWAHLLDEAAHIVYSVGALSPLESNLDPLMDVHQSLNPLLCLLEALRDRPDTSLVFLSSGGTIYGNTRVLPVPEDHPTDPITSYGILKLAAEKYIGMYRQLYGLEARVLRVANAYGPGQPVGRGQGVIGAFIDAVLRGAPVRVFGDGQTVRDYIHVDDIGRAVAALLRKGGPEVLNIGTGVGTSLLQIHDLLEDAVGRQIPIEFLESRGFDVRSIVLDVGPMRSLTGFAPIDLPTGLTDTWRYEAVRRMG